jgi:hypothetical protein
MAWNNPERTPLQEYRNPGSARSKKKVRCLLNGDSERTRRAIRLIDKFADREQRSKVNRLQSLPDEYNYTYMIYNLSKKLGQSEQYIRENYTRAEIYEHNLCDTFDNYVERELMKTDKR